MASGYETRTGGRDTFASQGPSLQRLGRGTASGESRGAQIVGGDTVAGGAPNVQITNPGSDAANLGAFFQKAMQPYVERKQQQRFFEGFVRAQSGEALDELSKSHKGVIGQLFGPTSLEQGAQFYGAMKNVDDWNVQMTSRMDELKKLPPEELSKELAKSSLDMMGDDPYVNQLTQKHLVETSQTLVANIAKERYSWQQDTARQGMHDSLSSAGKALQMSAIAAASTSDPSDPSVAAGENALATFLDRMQKPPGMSDETYQKTLASSLVGFAQEGDFYAYNALMSHGVSDVLTDEQQKKVQDAYDRYKGKTFEQAKGRHVEELLAVKLAVSKREMSALEAVAAVDKINAKITAETGITERAYDTEYLTKTGGDVIGMLAADARRDEERAYSERREKDREERAEGRKIREAQENLGAATTALSLGHPADYMMKGGKADALELAYNQAYHNKDFKSLGLAFQQEGSAGMSGIIAKMMQGKITSGGGVTMTGQVKEGFAEWQAMMQANPAAAAAYYGEQHPKLLFMQSQIDSHVAPEVAYQYAFAPERKDQMAAATVKPEGRKEARAALAAEVDGANSYRIMAWAGYQPRRMGTQAKNLMLTLGETQYANYQRNSHADPATIAHMAIGDIRGSNAFEYYGSNMAWSNKSGTKKAHQVIGVPELKFGDLLHDTIGEHMTALGIREGADGEYQMDRVPVEGGGFVLLVRPLDAEHRTVPILITSTELKARADRDARGEVSGNQPKPKYNGTNAFRHVPGETGWQRQQRIWKEVKAGADPVMHSPFQSSLDINFKPTKKGK